MSGMRRSVITRWNVRLPETLERRAAVGSRLDLVAVQLQDLAQVVTIELHVIDREDAHVHQRVSIRRRGFVSSVGFLIRGGVRGTFRLAGLRAARGRGQVWLLARVSAGRVIRAFGTENRSSR